MANIIYIILMVSIAAFLALYRFGLKLVHIDKFLAFFFMGIFISIFGLVSYYLFGNKDLGFSNLDKKSFLGIFLAGMFFVGNGILILQGFKNGYNLSTFTTAYSILSNIFVFVLGYLFFKEQISLYQFAGLLVGMIGIYLMSLN